MMEGVLEGTLEGIIMAIHRGTRKGVHNESLPSPPTLRAPYGLRTGILENTLIGPIWGALNESLGEPLALHSPA